MKKYQTSRSIWISIFFPILPGLLICQSGNIKGKKRYSKLSQDCCLLPRLSLRTSLSLAFFLSLSVSASLLSCSLSVCLGFYFSLPMFLSLSLFLRMSLCLSTFLSLSLFHFCLYFSSLFFYVCLCFSDTMSFYISVSLSGINWNVETLADDNEYTSICLGYVWLFPVTVSLKLSVSRAVDQLIIKNNQPINFSFFH